VAEVFAATAEKGWYVIRSIQRFLRCGVLMAVCGGCAVSQGEQAGQEPFARVRVHVGVPTNAMLSSDVDHDGHVDLVVSGAERVFVLRGRGDGQFDVAQSVMAGEHPSNLAVADLDGDGWNDVAVANHETDYVTLLFGGPGGDFVTREYSRFQVNVSPHPHAVLLQDVDADGHADLLVDDRTAEAVRLFKGLGDGTLSTFTLIAVGGDPYRGMALANLNGDGHVDLVTPNPDHVAVLLGDGTGRFAQDTVLRPGFYPFSVAAGDVNGDGWTDLVAGSGERVGSLVVWSGGVDGSFRAAGRYDIAPGPTTSTAEDLTGDNRAEVLVASYVGGEVAVLTGGDSPTLYRLEVEGNPYGLATGDFDGDGRTDFAVANDGAEEITVFLSRF